MIMLEPAPWADSEPHSSWSKRAAILMKLPLFSESIKAIKAEVRKISTVEGGEQVVEPGRTDEVLVEADKVTLLRVCKEQVQIENILWLYTCVCRNQPDQSLIMFREYFRFFLQSFTAYLLVNSWGHDWP